jgi:hypothetical protein
VRAARDAAVAQGRGHGHFRCVVGRGGQGAPRSPRRRVGLRASAAAVHPRAFVFLTRGAEARRAAAVPLSSLSPPPPAAALHRLWCAAVP